MTRDVVGPTRTTEPPQTYAAVCGGPVLAPLPPTL
jgi:hypothetical protein